MSEFIPAPSGTFSLVMLLVGVALGALGGFWGRKYWGKKDPESLTEADEAAKKFGGKFK